MVQPKVFVSHSHEDDSFTAQLVADLRAAGADVWVDVANIGTGDFQERINEALSACEWVVLVLTRAALDSPWVRQEINAAIRLKHQARIRDVLPIQAGSLNLSDLPPLWGVFNVFDAAGDYASARASLLRALGLPDTSANDLIGEGKILHAAGKYQEALPLVQHATELDPRSFDAWFHLGYTLVYLDRNEDAVFAYERALAIEPENPYAWSLKAGALSKLHRWAESEAAYDRALRCDSEHLYTWGTVAKDLRAAGRLTEAEAARLLAREVRNLQDEYGE